MDARLQEQPFATHSMRLRAAGLNARFLRVGIDGWQVAGRPLLDKPAGSTP